MGEWRQQSNLLRQALPFSDKKKASSPWSGTARLQGLSSTPRVKELLDCAYLGAEARAQQEGKAFDVNSLIADCSQAISRKPWSLDETGTFCASTQNYSFKVDRGLTGWSSLRRSFRCWVFQEGCWGESVLVTVSSLLANLWPCHQWPWLRLLWWWLVLRLGLCQMLSVWRMSIKEREQWAHQKQWAAGSFCVLDWFCWPPKLLQYEILGPQKKTESFSGVLTLHDLTRPLKCIEGMNVIIEERWVNRKICKIKMPL